MKKILLIICTSAAMYIIAVNPDPPFSECSIVFSGFEVDLVREALSLYGWRYNEDYKFVCNDNSTSKSAEVGRVLHDSYLYSSGYTYSYPTHDGSLGILVYSSTQMSTLKILNIFSVNLWIVPPCASVAMVVLLIVLEYTSLKIGVNFQYFEWLSVSSLFLGENHGHYRFPTKLLMLFYFAFITLLFNLLLAGCMYQNTEAVKLIDFPEKLENVRYTTYSEYLDYTAIYGGYYLDTGITSSNINDMTPLLKSKYLDAIVMEYDSLSNIAQTNCDFVIPAKPFISFFYAVKINPEVDPELKYALDWGLSSLYKRSDINGLKNAYFYTTQVCATNLNTISPVSFYQLLELFLAYIFAIFLIFLLREIFNKKQLVRQRNKHIEKIKMLQNKPESQIIKTTYAQTKIIEMNCSEVFQEIENNVKKTYHSQQRVLNIIRAIEIKLK